MTAVAARGPPRIAAIELGMLLGCVVLTGVGMAVWTGVIPTGTYAPGASQFTLEVPTCSNAGLALSHHWQAYPLWATVHVRWSSTGLVILYVQSGTYTPIAEAGTHGNGTLRSNAETFDFLALDPYPPNQTGCTDIVVSAAISYSI